MTVTAETHTPADAAPRPGVTGFLLRQGDRLAVIALGLLLVIIVPPVGEFAHGDDWIYALPVQTLLETGRLRLIPGMDASFVAQALWGALFSLVFGFSQTTLRCSTVVLTVLGALAFQDLARQVVGQRLALILTALLLVNPLVLYTAYSFQTDAPLIATVLLALAVSVRGLTGPRPKMGWLLAGGILVGLCYLIRQFGLAAAPAVLLAVLAAYGWRTAFAPRVLAVIFLPTLLTIVIWQVWQKASDLSLVTSRELLLIAFVREVGPAVVFTNFLTWLRPTLAYLGLFTLPVTAALVLSGTRLAGRWRIGAALAGLVIWWALLAYWAGSILTGAFVVPLGLAIIAPWPPRQQLDVPLRVALLLVAGWLAAGLLTQLPMVRYPTAPLQIGFTITEGGFQTNTMGGRLPAAIMASTTAVQLAEVLGLLGVPLLVAAAAQVPVRMMRNPALVSVLVFGMLVMGLVLGLAVWTTVIDRYFVPFIPTVLLLGALAAPRARAVVPLGLAGILLFGSWSLSWEREYLARQGAIWDAGRALAAQGIPPEQIDGGYEWNGWHRVELAVEAGRAIAHLPPPNWPYGVTSYAHGFYGTISPPDLPWYVDYRPDPKAACPDHILVVVPYLEDRQVYGLKRC